MKRSYHLNEQTNNFTKREVIKVHLQRHWWQQAPNKNWLIRRASKDTRLQLWLSSNRKEENAIATLATKKVYSMRYLINTAHERYLSYVMTLKSCHAMCQTIDFNKRGIQNRTKCIISHVPRLFWRMEAGCLENPHHSALLQS